ncbi:hypothetical protein FOYG_17490 [Fusarium oxysporum NRRL 32931]|uniref:Chromate transporter n=1 Tax=Fusarium oxysporum NRRL 32931 TaxID=660029 RepID=W9HAT8_FUSOX|nr:hypothetical protein FOYG_17490 [Fusarium oxysporum NRRL 32931]
MANQRSARLNTANLGERLWNIIRENWYLGFTSFGGPPVHFKIFHDKFVAKLSWIDEQMYQELFSVCQAFSGPGSTKMHYCINLLHDGFLPALFGFLLWSLKVITVSFQKKAKHSQNTSEEGVEMQTQQQATASNGHEEYNAGARPSSRGKDGGRSSQRIDENGTLPLTEHEALPAEDQSRVVPQERRLNISWKFGVLLIVLFLLSFIVVMVLRGTLPHKSRLYSLFSNMYLAGTIIFGGGPVVIPLLREYIVAENWVSPRDFLIGLALIQAFPGPNFNFAVYLGSLTAINGGYNSAVGAILGFLGIFLPGLLTVHGTMGVWSAIRGWRWVKSSLRGVNAAAVGLIYTAVYRLWQIGHIDEGFQQGTSLAVDPWWVVVTATSYVGGYWFRLSPPVAILAGAIMGLIWYGVISD